MPILEPVSHNVLPDQHPDIRIDAEKNQLFVPPLRHYGKWVILYFTSAAVFAIFFITSFSILSASRSGLRPLQIGQTSKRCTTPAVRREWRDLSKDEKADYIKAVKCLSSIPSRLGLNGSLHDDFAYIHSKDGSHCKALQDLLKACLT